MEVDPKVAERLLAEGVVALSVLAKLLPPTRGKARRPATLARWIEHGDKRLGVRLEGLRIGGVWHSTRPALARYLAALSSGIDPAKAYTRESLERQAAASRVEQLRLREQYRQARKRDREV